MKKYEKLALEIETLIKKEILKTAQKLPSIRVASQTYQVSPATVFQAYYLLERKGLIFAKEKSGYYVAEKIELKHHHPTIEKPPEKIELNVNKLIFRVLKSTQLPDTIPFSSAFPSPNLFPIDALNRCMSKGLKSLKSHPQDYMSNLTNGDKDLKKQIILRYLIHHTTVDYDEMIITNGAMEALSLSLQAITQAGDTIAIESPTFYAILQILENLKLKAIQIPNHAKGGLDLDYFKSVLSNHQIKACCLMTTLQNPVGSSLNAEKQAALYRLLAEYEIPAIIDDVYHELYFSRPFPLLKQLDKKGIILHCASFSKCLAPGYRVGWVAAGKFSEKINQLKLMTSLSTAIPTQKALATYLETNNYDRHLRKLRETLQFSQLQMRKAIQKYFPDDVAVSQPEGGYFLWIALNPKVDALQLYKKAFACGISIAPGPIFSASHDFNHYIRLNYGQLWNQELEKGMKKLGQLIASFY